MPRTGTGETAGQTPLASLSEGVRTLLEKALAQVQGILILRENAPTDLLSELPAGLAGRLRQIHGVRVVAAQVWKIAPPIEGRSLFARASAGDPEGALADYNESIRLDHKFAAAHANRGLARDALNQPEKALADLTEAIRLAPHVPLFHRNRAGVFHKLGRVEDERADIEKAIQLETTRRP